MSFSSRTGCATHAARDSVAGQGGTAGVCTLVVVAVLWILASCTVHAAPPPTALQSQSSVQHVDTLPARPAPEASRMPQEAERTAVVNRTQLRRTVTYFALAGICMLVALGLLVYGTAGPPDVQSLAVAVLAMVTALHAISASGVLGTLYPGTFAVLARARLYAGAYALFDGAVALILVVFYPRAFASLRVGRRTVPPLSALRTFDRTLASRPAAPAAWFRGTNSAVAYTTIAASVVLPLLVGFAGRQAATLMLSVTQWMAALLAVVVVAVVLHGVGSSGRAGKAMAAALGLLALAGLYDVLLTASSRVGPTWSTVTAVLFVLLYGYLMLRAGSRRRQQARAEERRVARDIEHDSRQAQATAIAAQAATLARSHFLSAVSHELRTPITSMLGYTQLLREELDAGLTPEQREFFDTLRTSGERLLGLINDLLDLAKMEAGRLVMELGPVASQTVAQEVVGQTYPLARKKGLTLDLQVGEAPLVLADEHRLRQALLNLVSNAIKFTDQGSVSLAIGTASFRDAPAVSISVRDTGKGISDDFLPQLFERFTQERQAARDAFPGTGLGLTISRELVHRMNGEIVVDSTVDQGSTFTILLPAVESGASPARGR